MIDPNKLESEYLGEGVYVRFDGFQHWLAANDHRNDVVALEPQVLFSLMRYLSRNNPELTQALKDKLNG